MTSMWNLVKKVPQRDLNWFYPVEPCQEGSTEWFELILSRGTLSKRFHRGIWIDFIPWNLVKKVPQCDLNWFYPVEPCQEGSTEWFELILSRGTSSGRFHQLSQGWWNLVEKVPPSQVNWFSLVEPCQEGSTEWFELIFSRGTLSRRFHRVIWIDFISWNLVEKVPPSQVNWFYLVEPCQEGSTEWFALILSLVSWNLVRQVPASARTCQAGSTKLTGSLLRVFATSVTTPNVITYTKCNTNHKCNKKSTPNVIPTTNVIKNLHQM